MERVSDSSTSAGEAVMVQTEGEMDLMRKGPWTVDEDLVLVNYIAVHGEGRWNSLARSAGLKRTGKSCRLRWLNYLRPDIRRGNFTPEEQLFILELHSKWGNRWSKIAQQLPGRTDNEIKNYWRTRVQKHAKQLKCDVNSQQFKDAVRRLWMPRLLEKIQAASAAAAYSPTATVARTYVIPASTAEPMPGISASDAPVNLSPDHSSTAGTSSDSYACTWSSSLPLSDLTDCYIIQGSSSSDCGDGLAADHMVSSAGGCSESLMSPGGDLQQGFLDLEQNEWETAVVGLSSENWWAADDLWFSQQRL